MSMTKTGPIHVLCACVLICPFIRPMSVSAGGLNQLTQEEKDAGFRLLFDGTSMDAWRNYKSETTRPEWKVEGGELVLTGKGGRDLVTREKFRHFDLRLEYTIAEGGNSGIMFRVEEDPEEKLPWRLAPVCPRQIEFQLFDSYNVKVRGERSAGALYGLVAAPENLARKPGDWNQVRILLEPAGNNADRLRCWLNDRPTIDLVVDHSPDSEWSKLINQYNLEKNGTKYELPPAFFKAKTGHILLQDHGARVAFRSIRIRELDATRPHTLCEEEVAEGFELIFDGETFDGWKQRDGNWIVEDGTICRAKRGGSLIYEEKPLPDDFEFRFDWKIAPGTNSGVKYRNANFEYQILDNSSKPVELLNPRQAAASIYFGVAPCCDMTKEPGQWNTGRIVCKGTVVQHWLNGKKVVDLDCTDPAMKEYVDMLEFHGSDMDFRGGNLLLQDHGGKVWYRNLRLREIPRKETISHESLEPMPIPAKAIPGWEAVIEKIRKKKAEEELLRNDKEPARKRVTPDA